jgi:DNA-directed RNA polymerase specialized sigma24 family protein
MPAPSRDEIWELDWMLQNGEIEDEVLGEAIIREYYHSLCHLSLFIVEDISQANQAVHNAVRKVIKRRHKYNGLNRLKTILFSTVVQESRRVKTKKYLVSRFVQASPNKNRRTFSSHFLHETTTEEAELLAAMSQENFLLLFLHYAHDYSADDIALISGLTSRNVAQVLNQLRKGLLKKRLTSKRVLEETHLNMVDQILSAGINTLSENGVANLDLHISECGACKVMVDEVHSLDKTLGQVILSSSPFGGNEPIYVQEMKQRHNESHRRLLRFNFKELFVGIAALFGIALMGWYGSHFYVNTDIVVATDIAPKNIYIMQITATPRAVEVMATPVPPPVRPGHKGPDPIISLDTENSRKLAMINDSGRLPFSVPHQPVKVSGSSALATVLSYWGWEGSVDFIVDLLQPNPYSSNLLPSEMVNFVSDQTDLKAIYQTGGDFSTIKDGIDAGYPIIVQKSHAGFRVGVSANPYQVIYGYTPDNERIFFLLEIGQEAASSASYNEFAREWEASDFLYMVVFPKEDENRVRRVLQIYHDMGYYKYLLMSPVGYDHYFR